MTTYRYKARDREGQVVHGVIEAYNEFEAVDHIKRTCPIVEKIEPVKGRRIAIDLNEPLWVEDKSLSLVASQFSIMLKAGLPMSRVVALIAEQTNDKLMKRILNACADDVAAGYSLAQSLEKNGKKIPVTFIETVRAGEESGTLEMCFTRLEQYYDKAHTVKKKVKSAMSYPIFLLVLTVVVVAIVMVVLVPGMLEMVTQFGTELPLPTQILMMVSAFFETGWPVMLGGVVLLAITYFLYARTPQGGLKVANMSLKIPIIGKISTMNAASQVANTMCTLLAAGLPMVRVLDLLSRVVDNRAVGQSLAQAVSRVEAGARLADALRDNPYLPPMLVEMVSVGEEAGMLEETMHTIGTYYDAEAQSASERALGMLEPIITVVMGLMIGFLVLGIYLPMFMMSTSV